jgi:Zn-dependent protease with chaperone function
MLLLNSFLRQAFCFLAAVASVSAVGAERLVWNARDIVAKVGSPVVELKSNGNVVERVDLDSVRRTVEVTQRMAAAYGMAEPGIVLVKDAPSPNAFATTARSGQPVMGLNTEMLRLAGKDEGLLAGVIGHELGHLKAKHTTEGAQRAAGVALLGTLIGVLVDANQARHGVNTNALGTKLGQAGGALVNAKFSRDQEREADQLGVEHMAKAGYDPAAASRLWRMMGKGGSGAWFDSHPSHPERESAMSTAAMRLQPVYAENARTPQRRALAALDFGTDPYPAGRYSKVRPTDAESAADAGFALGHAAFVAKKWNEAAVLLREPAEQGDERALYLLGGLAESGRGQPVDANAAADLYAKAAAKGFAAAIASLGQMSLTGRGRVRDMSEGLRLHRIAASRGYEPSLGVLSLAYAEGLGVARDDGVARAFAEQASSEVPLAKAVLGVLMRDGRAIEADPTRGLALLADAAESNPWARYQLGLSYERGLGTGPDREKAIEMYERAAAGGFAAAKARLQQLHGQ